MSATPPSSPGPLRKDPRSPRLSKDELGRLGEEHAETHLVAAGHIVLERRWRSHQGELDLITLDDGELVAVEVKTRRGLGCGHPFEAVTGVKLTRLHRLLREYAAGHTGVRVPLRVDAVAVLFPARTGGELGVPQIEHLEDLRP